MDIESFMLGTKSAGGGGGGGGGNVIGGTTLPSNADGENGDLYVEYSDYTDLNIPNYTPYEYLQNVKTDKVNTEIRPTIDVETEVKVVFQNVTAGPVFGINSSKDGYVLTTSQSKLVWPTQSYLSSDTISTDTEYIIKVNKSSLTVNGVTYTGVPLTSYYDYKLSFFSVMNVSNYGLVKLYYAKMTSNGSLIHHLVPAKANSGGNFGLYDLVTDTFYAGSASLVAGRVAEGKPIDAVFVKKNGIWIPMKDADWTDINI